MLLLLLFLVLLSSFACILVPASPPLYPVGSQCIDSCFPTDPLHYIDHYLSNWNTTIVELTHGSIHWLDATSSSPSVDFPRLYMNGISGPMLRSVSGMEVLWLDCTGPTADTCPPVKLSYHNKNAGPDIIHAHGLIVPYIFDGVPYISATPAQSNGWYNISYNLTSSQAVGTYFVHSHFAFNHDDGMTMPLILKGPVDSSYPLASVLNSKSTTDLIVFLEDFCPYAVNDVNTAAVDPTIPAGVSYCGSAMDVFHALHVEWIDGFKRYDFVTPQSGDLGANGPDVQYTAQFANYRRAEYAYSERVYPGQNIRVRVINSGGMTEYLVTAPPGLSFTVIAADGFPILPVFNQTQWWVGVAQRTDFLLTIPENATDGTIYPINNMVEGTAYQASVVLYVGAPPPTAAQMPTYFTPPAGLNPVMDPQYYGSSSYNFNLDMNLNQVQNPGQSSEWQEWNMNASMPVGFTPTQADRFYSVHLTGNNGFMSINYNSYLLPPMAPVPATVWSQNAVPLRVKYGDRVCLQFTNFDSDSHAMHLHGHTFQVMEVDGLPINGARRDVVTMPRGDARTVTVCFTANNPYLGIHPLHCHLQYHMMAGMFTTIEYVSANTIISPLVWPPRNLNTGYRSTSFPLAALIPTLAMTLVSFFLTLQYTV